MTLGRTLWAIIAIKVVVFFVIIKWLFFPDFLAGKADTDEGKADYVRERLERKGPLNPPKGGLPVESRESRTENQEQKTENQEPSLPLSKVPLRGI